MSSLKLAFQELASALKAKWLRLSYQKSRKKGWIVQHARTAPSTHILHGTHVHFYLPHRRIIISFLLCVLDTTSSCIVPWWFLMFFFLFYSFSDEEKVGPWPRGPIFPFRKKALQRPRIFKVKQPKFHPKGLPAAQHRPSPNISFMEVFFCFPP